MPGNSNSSEAHISQQKLASIQIITEAECLQNFSKFMNSQKCTAAVKTISTAVCFALTFQTRLFLLLNWVKRPTSTHHEFDV